MSSVPSSSPVKHSHKSNAGNFPVSEARERAPKVRKLMEQEMLKHWVGPMPVKEFLEEFMDALSQDPVPIISKDFFKGVSNKTTNEKEMYKEFLQLMDKEGSNFLPGYKLVNTSSKADNQGDQLWRIDLTCYANKVKTDKRANQQDKAEWGIEFKFEDAGDPFGASDNFVDEDDETKADVRGQITTYAAEWFSHQHRTHVFMVFISKTFARFLRFDRSGAVVSERFNYAEDSTPLVQFMWYFSHLSAEKRGLDPTVGEADPESAETFRAKLLQFHARVAMLEVKPDAIDILKKTKIPNESGEPAVVDLIDENWDKIWDVAESVVRDSLNDAEKEKAKTLAEERMPSQNRKVVFVKVYYPDGKKYNEVLTQGFRSSAESVVGRSTRAWPAWDPMKKKLFYLKDSWRPDVAAVVSEAMILQELNKKHVERVPRLVCGGDVPRQNTRTADFTGAPNENDKRRHWVSGAVAITPRVHHRFLMDFVGRSIKHYSRSKQMLQAVFDAFSAHKDAWTKCQILHRDISVNNVMLDRWGRGVLNDWDLAKKQPGPGKIERPRRHARTGTWYFMSTLLLITPGKAHTVQDDLESFVLLVLYLALSYTSHSWPRKDLGNFMKAFFEQCSAIGEGVVFGGERKYLVFNHPHFFLNQFAVKNSDPLNFWLQGALGAVSEWIKAYGRAETIPEKLKLYDHQHLSLLFQDALDLDNWPAEDKVTNIISLGKIGMRSSGGDGGSSKRSLEDVLDDPRAKRQKLSTGSSLDAWSEDEDEEE